MNQVIIDLARASASDIDRAVELLIPLFQSCYPRATPEVVRFSFVEKEASISRVRVFLDDEGRAVGYSHLTVNKSMEIAGRKWTVFRHASAVQPNFRGSLPISKDMADESMRFRLRHPFTPAIYCGVGSLPGYHFVVRNSHRAYPSPYRPTPAWLEDMIVHLGHHFYGDEPGTYQTDDPLVLSNEMLSAPEDQAEWLRTHKDVDPEITDYFLRRTQGHPERFVLYVIPGDWSNFFMTWLDDRFKRIRRVSRRWTRVKPQ